MRKILLLALGVATLALGGCEHLSRTESVWEGPGNFSVDQGQCHAQAFSVPGAPAMQIALVYNSCMRGKGWQLVDRPKQR